MICALDLGVPGFSGAQGSVCSKLGALGALAWGLSFCCLVLRDAELGISHLELKPECFEPLQLSRAIGDGAAMLGGRFAKPSQRPEFSVPLVLEISDVSFNAIDSISCSTMTHHHYLLRVMIVSCPVCP